MINACRKRKYSADKVQIFHNEFHCFITIVSLTVQQLHTNRILILVTDSEVPMNAVRSFSIRTFRLT